MAGKRGPTRSLVTDLFTHAQWTELARRFGLSKRQAEIARLICRAGTNEIIADRLRLSQATVRMHTDALFKRVGVQCRIGLLVRFVEVTRAIDCAGAPD